jgi:hypothetical protein
METLTISGTVYSLAELEALLGIDIEPPLSPEQVAALTARLDRINRERSPLTELLLASVLLALLPRRNRETGTVYVIREAAYYRGNARLSDQQIRQLITRHQARTGVLIDAWTDDLINRRMALGAWGRLMGDRIVDDHLRMAQLGAGTRGGISTRTMENLHRRLVAGMGGDNGMSELDALARLMGQIDAGEISEAQLRARARAYGGNTRASYEEARHSRLVGSGQWEGIRRLDPAADHCPECPGYQRLEWTPIEDIVAPGVNCRCRGKCRCSLIIRPVNLSDRLPTPA